jgi:molybdenum cofactor synthesis domain-containing protein
VLFRSIIIEGIRLLRKSGGKSGDYNAQNLNEIKNSNANASEAKHHNSTLYSGVLTISDKGHAGERVDTSGQRLAELLSDFGTQVKRRAIVPDEKEKIAAQLIEWADKDNLELILTTGGTGLSPRDVTPEALLLVGDRIVPGIGECMRIKSMPQTSNAMLSRSIAVTRGKTLIIALPGSERGSTSCFEAIKPALNHAIEILNNQHSDCGKNNDKS